MDKRHNLYNLYFVFYSYEELLKHKKNSKDIEGYLIEKNSIEQIKQNIFYDKLKQHSNPIVNNFNRFAMNPEVKEYLDKYKEIETNIIQVKFKNGEELIKSLNDNKKYYLINKPIWNKICKKKIINEKGIPFSFEKNYIILCLNDKTEKLYFKKNGGIIEKESFIKFDNSCLYNIKKIINRNNLRLDMLNSEENKDSSFNQSPKNDNNLKCNKNFIFASENKKIKEFKINENDYNEGNSNIKFSHNINNDIQHTNLLSSNNNQNIINDGNIELHEQKVSDKKNVLNTQNTRRNIDVEENIIIETNQEDVNDDINKFKELKNILSIIIDIEKIKYKMKMPLKSGKSDESYLLNYDWFRKYLELTNVDDEVYEHLVKSIKNNINISNINVQNEMLIEKAISLINPDIKMKIKNDRENYYKLKNNDLFNLDSSIITIKEDKTLEYYYNFILISPETMELLNKDFPFDYDKSLILLGDNKAVIKNINEFIIEILFINNKNIFIPELFFCFLDENIFMNNFNLLVEEGYEQYIQNNLIFTNDYASIIFDKNNDNIGFAFKYNSSIKDYSIYQINEQLKAMIKLFFNHVQLKNKLNSKELLEEKYLIFDIKYIQKIKEFFDYNKLEKELNNNIIAKQYLEAFEKNNKANEYNILDDKKISLIIKNLPEEINTNYYKKKFNFEIIGCQDIPNLITLKYEDLSYYNNFELVDKSIFDILLGQNNYSSLYEEKYNYLECIFIEKYILINISSINSKYNLEVCIINDNNNINPLYLLEYDNKDNFTNHINYVKTIFGVENFFESLNFTYNNRISMNDENEKEIGFILNLGINNNINKQNLSNEGNYQKSDKLIMDNNYNRLKENSETSTINEDQNISDPCFTQIMLEKHFYGISPSSNQPINNKIENEINPYNKPQISNNNQANQISSILESFPFPPKIGLQNVDAKYLMKATLQCFRNIFHFADFFKSNSKVEETINKYLIEKKISLTSLFKILIDNLWPYRNKIQEYYCGKNTNNKYFIPQELKLQNILKIC